MEEPDALTAVRFHAPTLHVRALEPALHAPHGDLEDTPTADVLSISRISSAVIAGVYVLFLIFQLFTHAHLFAAEGVLDQDLERLSFFF